MLDIVCYWMNTMTNTVQNNARLATTSARLWNQRMRCAIHAPLKASWTRRRTVTTPRKILCCCLCSLFVCYVMLLLLLAYFISTTLRSNCRIPQHGLGKRERAPEAQSRFTARLQTRMRQTRPAYNTILYYTIPYHTLV